MSALLLDCLKRDEPLVTVELRPPRADLSADDSMDVWIDLHHTVRRLTRDGRFVFLTDNAVGSAEEENLAHVGANLGGEADLRRVVPFLTCKHALDYCLMYAERAASEGFESLTVLGGDASVGPPRCVPHGHELRALIAARVPALTLGGWANPHRDATEQAAFLAEAFHGDYYLSQVVSHHSAAGVERLLAELRRRRVALPGVFGVFYYRSANPRTLQALDAFFPVPAEALTREFDAGASPEEICARSIRALRDVGADKVYVSNLGSRRVAERLRGVLERV